MNNEYAYNTPDGASAAFAKYALPYEPDDPDWVERQVVTVKCARCPRWAGTRTTSRDMTRVYAAHRETRHG